MRAGVYYAIAVLLVIATVPMYRYILERTSPLRHPPAPPPVVTSVPVRPAVVVPPVKLWYAYNEALPPGYRCSGAKGTVYRTREEKGATVVEPLYRSGQIVRCGGDWRSSYRP